MNKFCSLILTLSIIYFTTSCAVAQSDEKRDYSDSPVKGWEHAYNLLKNENIDEEKLMNIFTDERMPMYSPLKFNVKPSEKHIDYKKRLNKSEYENAFAFFQQYREAFKQAEDKYGVPASIILAILQTETRCGKFTGKEVIVHKLAWLASATSSESIDESFQFNFEKDENITFDNVVNRARKLQNIFLPHLLAALQLAEREQIHPLELKGSYAGAIGLPQFMPNNVFLFGVDGNGDGKIDLYDPLDAIPSVANFMKQHGWKGGKNYTRSQKEKLILHYNRSTPYAETVVKMADNLREMMVKEQKRKPDKSPTTTRATNKKEIIKKKTITKKKITITK